MRKAIEESQTEFGATPPNLILGSQGRTLDRFRTLARSESDESGPVMVHVVQVTLCGMNVPQRGQRAKRLGPDMRISPPAVVEAVLRGGVGCAKSRQQRKYEFYRLLQEKCRGMKLVETD